MRWLRNGALGLLALVVLAWATDGLWAVPLIVAAPNTNGARPSAAPADAITITVDSDGERIEGWVVGPEDPRGTVVVLHGIRDRKDSMEPLGRQLADRGFRVLLADLRGHGGSTGAHLSYGVHDRRDLSALLDAMDERELLVEPVGVHGTSYGAGAALMLAAHDPRIRAAVSIAPFASLREVVPAYATLIFGPVGDAFPDVWIEDIVDRAGEAGRFDPDDACPRCAATAFRGALFLAHGTADRRIPPWHGDLIERARGGLPIERHVVEGAHHGTIGGAVADEAIEFLVAELATN